MRTVIFKSNYAPILGKRKNNFPSLLVVEGGQIEHFDKVTEEEQPAMNRYCYCNNLLTNLAQSSKPCGSEQPSNVGHSEQDIERQQGSVDGGQQCAGPAGHH